MSGADCEVAALIVGLDTPSAPAPQVRFLSQAPCACSP